MNKKMYGYIMYMYKIMCWCAHTFLYLGFLSCVITFESLHMTLCFFGGLMPSSLLQQQHHRSLHQTYTVAGSELIMAMKPAERFLVPPSHSPGHSLRLHLKTSQPWPSFPASFAENSFCFVQMVAGGGGKAVRSSSSQKGWRKLEKYYHSKRVH